MKLPTIVFLTVCGGFLVTGGTLIGSDVTLGFGIALWTIAIGLVLYTVVHFAVDAWHDWRMKRYFREIRKRSATPVPRYSRNVGMR